MQIISPYYVLLNLVLCIIKLGFIEENLFEYTQNFISRDLSKLGPTISRLCSQRKNREYKHVAKKKRFSKIFNIFFLILITSNKLIFLRIYIKLWS